MSRLRLLLPAFATLVCCFGTGTVTASAHNAAYIYVDGRCLQVGSLKDAPVVGPGAPQNALGELDLIYDPRNGVDLSDQYGARLAAIKGQSRLLQAIARCDLVRGSATALPSPSLAVRQHSRRTPR